MNTSDSKIVAMAEEALAARERVPSSVVAELLAIIRRSQQRTTDSLDAEVQVRAGSGGDLQGSIDAATRLGVASPVRVSGRSMPQGGGHCLAGLGGGEVCHLAIGHGGRHEP